MKTKSTIAPPKDTAMERVTGPSSEFAPTEPVLDIQDIQGHIVPGFNKPLMVLLALRIDDVAASKQWLKNIIPYIATLEEVLAFRRLFSARRKRLGHKPTGLVATYTNIGFSFEGLKKLTHEADQFQDQAFRLGLPARSALLGDPTDPHNEGNPKNWVVGGLVDIPDILLICAGDNQDILDNRVAEFKISATESGLQIIYEEAGNVRPDLPGHEHFGFDDGVSQPGVRGRLSDAPQDYLTRRYIDPSVIPDSLLFGLPGQDLVWPGEFIFGYPSQSPDPLIPGKPTSAGPAWSQNGSYLAFRRLRQDVALFWKFMQQQAEALAKQPGFEGLTATKLASMLVGRWPSGAPFSRTPGGDNEELGLDQYANNHFIYGTDTTPIKLVDIPGYGGDHYANAKADPVGLICPQAAHIRKVNTRDAPNDQGGHNTTFNVRLLRRGLPFGAPLENPLSPGPDPLNGNRGLLFLSYHTSIENQFEFLHNAWMSDNKPPRAPSGMDMVVGQNGRPGESRIRSCTLFGQGAVSTTVETNDAWIVPTGGGYFFAPSISALVEVLSK